MRGRGTSGPHASPAVDGQRDGFGAREWSSRICSPGHATLKSYEADLDRRLDRLTALVPTHPAGGKLQTVIRNIRRHLFVFIQIVISRRPTTARSGRCAPMRSTARSPTASATHGALPSRRHQVGHRNRAPKINPGHRRHPPHPPRNAAADLHIDRATPSSCRRQCHHANRGSVDIRADVRCRQEGKIVASAPKTKASKKIITFTVTLRGTKPPV